MLQDLKQAIDNKVIRIYDKETINELYSFVVVQTSSSWKAQADKGAKDDLCISLGISYQVSLFAKEPVTEKQAQVYYDQIEDLHKKLFDEQGFY